MRHLVSRDGWRCASIRLLPFDSWTVLCGFTKRCGFPQTWSDAQHLCAERLLSRSLLGALSPCPTVNAALCPRSSSTLPSPSLVHNRPIVSHSAVHRVFSTLQLAVLALSLFYPLCPSNVSDSRATLALLLLLPRSLFGMDPRFRWPAPDCLWTLLLLFLCSILGARSLDLRPVSRGSGCEAPGALIFGHSGRSFLRLFLQLFVGNVSPCRPSRPVVSCFLPNSTLHSARLIPRPYLVCWAGLRAFCLAVTISFSQLPLSTSGGRRLPHFLDEPNPCNELEEW